MDPKLISLVASILFASDAPPTMPVQDVYGIAAGHDRVEIDEILRAFEASRLIKLSLDGRTTRPTLRGKISHEDGSLTAVVLGKRYVVAQFQDAVVHVIVSGPDGESGATGFFSAEFPNCILTASHVVRDRNVLRIEDRRGVPVCGRTDEVILGPPDLDIAAIHCQIPDGVKPLQIEWRPEAIEPLDDVLILGYPPFPNHHPALFHATANIHAMPLDYHLRSKLLISSITRPGCSGGPVISVGGFVVGIVEQENDLQQGNVTHAFFTATIARHASEIMPRNR